MNNVPITLAGEEIEIFDLSIIKAQAWRKAARPIVEQQDLIVTELRAATESQDTDRIKALNRDFETLIDEHIHTMLSLVLDYLPDQDCRKEYKEQATIEEAIAAFFILARRTYKSSEDFFMVMWHALSQNGLPDDQTGTTSVEVNGGSGQAN